MKSICGYWALDGAPTRPAVLAAMRVAGVQGTDPHLEQWRSDDGAVAFGSAWWSPQHGLQRPSCIARHPATDCVVIADARLDNPAELRTALALPAPEGAPDRTADHAATLILHAWLRWGEDCVDRIDGDFAFAVHDPRQQLLYLARDRMGQRPLYVHHLPGRLLVFGSTSHAVLAHPRVPEDLNEARIADYLLEAAGAGLEGVDFTSTFHLAVERHPPRHVLRVSPNGQHLRRYWQLEPGRAGHLPKTDDAWAEALTEAMERAVAQRLAGPERVGSMLSGGLDSTSLAIIAGDQLRASGLGPLPTFSAVHSGLRGCKETEAVGHLTGMPIFKPTRVDIANLDGLLQELEKFLDDFDEPFDVNMALVDAQYAAAAGLGVDSMIDGGNGDCLFLFGSTLRRQIRSGQWLTAWRNAKGLASFGGRPRNYLTGPMRSALAPGWLRKALHPSRYGAWQKSVVDSSLISPELATRTRVPDRLERMERIRSFVPLDTTHEAAEALQHTFPVAGSERYFRVAARHGVTPLTPLTERRLLELCVHLPDRQRLRDGWTKPVLRHAMQGRMPDPVRLRSDKQHLGSRLNFALWEGLEARLRQRVRAGQTILAPFISIDRFASAEREDQIKVAQLAHWLQRRRPARE